MLLPNWRSLQGQSAKFLVGCYQSQFFWSSQNKIENLRRNLTSMKFVDQFFRLCEFMGNRMPISNYYLWDFYVTVEVHSVHWLF